MSFLWRAARVWRSQRYVPNIYKARASDFQRATQRIYRAGPSGSRVRLTVLP